jgi:integrative and conjugative element protein (TIGR02256 family)
MQLLLPAPVLKRLDHELRCARRNEIGGLLLGEHLGGEVFSVVDFSVQRSGGSFSHFTRNPEEHRAELQRFFAETGNDYARFNYLGEWHSHPSFEAVPSGTDILTMQSIVEDPDVGVNFLILLVCRMGVRRRRKIELSAMAFRPGALPQTVPVSFEQQAQDGRVSFVERIRRFVGL